MTLTHAIVAICLSLIFLFFTLRIIATGYLHIKYALIYLGIGFLAFLSPLLYGLATILHVDCDFPSPSSQLFMGAIFLLYLICLLLTSAISRAKRERISLAREIALLESRINDLETSGRDAKYDQ